MNNAIEKSLKTWYAKDHPLHLDPMHPAIKLAGEAGEILDLYGKNEYKPGFDWWKCVCGYSKFDHIWNLSTCENYTPLILDELGDYWYYLRILSYIYSIEFQERISENKSSMAILLADMNSISASLYKDAAHGNKFRAHRLNWCYVYLTGILRLLNTTIDELTELNYIKLNSDPTNHGWKGA